MAQPQSFADFSMKNWKNFGIYITLLGLFILFLTDQYKIGAGFTAIGILFLAIFHGTKVIKVFNK